MNVIVGGMTDIGLEIAVYLADRGLDVTAIDRDGDRLGHAEKRLDALFIESHEGTIDTLRRAHAEHADLVVYATKSDELNLFAAAQARQLGAKRTIALVRFEDHLGGAPGLARNIHDVDFVLCPIILTAAEAHRVAHSLRVLNQTHIADGRITVEEIPVDHDDPVVGHTIDQIGLPDSVRLVALVRDGVWVPAAPRERLQVGDRVILVGRRGAILRAERRFQPGGQRALRQAFVVGGGRIGLHVSRAFLAEGVKVTLVDRDHARCKKRAIDLPDATIIHGDGTDIYLLEQEGVRTSDVVVACTNDDESNLVASLLALRLKTPHAVTLVHRPQNVVVYEHLGLEATVSRPLVMANHVGRVARRGEATDVVEIADGMLLAIDFLVHGESEVVGHTVGDIPFPANTIPCFVVKQTSIVPATSSTLLEDGDQLIAVVPPKQRKSIEALFRSNSRGP